MVDHYITLHMIIKIMNCKGKEQTKQGDWERKLANHKFLSIKSIAQNKKMVVKKSLPAKQMNHTLHGLITEQTEPPPHTNKTIKGHSSQKKYASDAQIAHSTNIVKIQFQDKKVLERGPHSNHNSTIQEQRLRKRIMNSLLMQQMRKGTNVRQKTGHNNSQTFQDTLVIEPLQKQTEVSVPFQRKKGIHSYMGVTKKNHRSSFNCEMLGTNRTISDLKPIGRQIELSKQKERFGRKTVTSFNNKKSIASEADNEKIFYSTHKNGYSSIKETNTVQLIKKQEQLERQRQVEREEERQINEIVRKQFKDFLPLRKPTIKKDYFTFSMSEKFSNEPENKIQLYRDFLWKVNYSNALYVHTPEAIDQSYRAYIGSGNNSCMIKSIIRRRFWWTIVESSSSVENCQFVWTQLKINSFFKNQNHRQVPTYEKGNDDEKQFYEQIKNITSVEDEDQQMLLAHSKMFNFKDWRHWHKHVKKNPKHEQKITQKTYMKRLPLYAKKQITKIGDSSKLKLHNHLEFNYYLGNKKALFYNMKRLCHNRGEDPFQYIPMTFHISKGIQDPLYQDFVQYFSSLEQKKMGDRTFRNIWIAKPGENTNRGNGISVCFGLDDIRHRLRGRQKNSDGKPRTFILQKYIEKPFLYKNRKFDIRHFILITCFNGRFKGYWFDQGYIRTSSSPFCLRNCHDVLVHLTNDAVQKKSDLYGKHEKGNKVSYQDFQKYLNTYHKRKKYDFLGSTIENMKEIALMAIQSTFSSLDPSRKENNFELIGLDFMIDQNFKPWLIEANTNPCLELSCPLLEKLIPNLIQQTFRLCVDPLFPPPENWINKKQFFGENPILQNKFELIFDEVVDGEEVVNALHEGSQKSEEEFSNAMGRIQEDDEVFQDDGNDKWEEKEKTN